MPRGSVIQKNSIEFETRLILTTVFTNCAGPPAGKLVKWFRDREI